MSISYNPNYYFAKAQQFSWISLKPIYQYKNSNRFCQFLNHHLSNQKVSTFFINIVHHYLSGDFFISPNGSSFHQFYTTLLIESRKFKAFFSISYRVSKGQKFLLVSYNPTYRVIKTREIFNNLYQCVRTILIKLQKPSSFDLFLTTIFISLKIISTVL